MPTAHTFSSLPTPLRDAILDCETPSASRDSVLCVLHALRHDPILLDWHHRFLTSSLADGLPQGTTFDTHCVRHWSAVQPFLLTYALTSPALSILVILCANHGAPVPVDTLELCLRRLGQFPSPIIPQLTPMVVQQLRVPFLSRLVIAAEPLVARQWDTTHPDRLRAWLLHPFTTQHSTLLTRALTNTCRQSLFWEIWDRIADDPDATAAYTTLLGHFPPNHRLALLMAMSLPDETLLGLLRQLTDSSSAFLIRLPRVTIPFSVWMSLSPVERLRLLILFYSREPHDRPLGSLLLPPAQIDRDVTDVSIRGDASELVSRFLLARATHRALYGVQADA